MVSFMMNINSYLVQYSVIFTFAFNCYYRTRDCKKMDTFLHCASQPIIEASTGMKFGCYQYSYSELKGKFE